MWKQRTSFQTVESFSRFGKPAKDLLKGGPRRADEELLRERSRVRNKRPRRAKEYERERGREEDVGEENTQSKTPRETAAGTVKGSAERKTLGAGKN